MVSRELLVIPIFRVSNDVFVIFIFRENVEDAWKLACSIPFHFSCSHFCGAAFFAFLDMWSIFLATWIMAWMFGGLWLIFDVPTCAF